MDLRPSQSSRPLMICSPQNQDQEKFCKTKERGMDGNREAERGRKKREGRGEEGKKGEERGEEKGGEETTKPNTGREEEDGSK